MIDIETIFNEGGASGMGWSEIAAFLRCPREYQLSKVIGVVKPKQATPDYFAVGTMVHAGRARVCCSTVSSIWGLVRLRAGY